MLLSDDGVEQVEEQREQQLLQECAVGFLCRAAEEAPCFHPGNWNVTAHREIALHGHDALRFQTIVQNDALDRHWFGVAWFSVDKCKTTL